MTFDNNKKIILSKPDYSKKGSIDKRIKKLCDILNKHSNYFTLSSCSGRTMLIRLRNGQKKGSEWLAVTHEKAKFEDFKNALDKNREGVVIFKHEPVIIHICAWTIELGQKLVDDARNNGFKKASLIATKNKVVVEIVGSECLFAPVFDKKRLVSDEYLNYLIKSANKKIKVSWKLIKTLEKLF